MISYNTFSVLQYIYKPLAFISILTYTITAFYIFNKNFQSMISRSFVFFCVNFVLYILSVLLLHLVHNEHQARMVMLYINAPFGSLMPMSFYYFLCYIGDTDYSIQKDKKSWVYCFLCIIAIGWFFYHVSDAMIFSHPLQRLNDQSTIWFYPERSNASYYFMAVYIWVLSHAIYKLKQSRDHSSSYEAKQFFNELMVFTSACSLIGLEDTFFLQIETGFFPFSPIAGIVYIGFIFYALVKYRFIELGIEGETIASFIMGIMLFFLVLIGFIPLLYVLWNNLIIRLISISIVTGLLYFTIRLISQKQQIKTEILSNKANEVTKTENVESFLEESIKDYTKSDKVRIVLFENAPNSQLLIENNNEKTSNDIQALLNFISTHKKQIDLTIVSQTTSEDSKQQLSRALELLNASICIPLIYNNKLKGIIIIEEKFKRVLYSSNEISALNTFAQIVAFALENNKLLKRQQEIIMDVSHELKTPLTAIRLSAQSLKKLLSGRPNLKNRLELILTENERYLNIIENLIDNVRLGKNSEISILKTPVALNEIALQAISLFRMVSEEKGINLDYNIDKNLPEICCDKDKIKQVVINFLSNSMKYTKPGGKIILGTFLDNDTQSIILEVKDDGIGISQQDQLNIFKIRNFRSNRSRQLGEGGAGIGLTICHEIINSHGGKIDLESNENKGSSFWFSLPLKTNQQC